MLNNINDHGLSKSKEVIVLNFPGATILRILILRIKLMKYWNETRNH